MSKKVQKILELPDIGNLEFKMNGVQYSLEFMHNFPTTTAMEEAYYRWLHHTKIYTVQSFCNYVNAKGIYYCAPLSEYNELMEKNNQPTLV